MKKQAIEERKIKERIHKPTGSKWNFFVILAFLTSITVAVVDTVVRRGSVPTQDLLRLAHPN